jgi:SAM-dependent methyltransferase
VFAIDFVASMVNFAREKAAAAGLRNIEFRVIDGEQLDLPSATFDAATMRWGLMFMPDPAACLERIHRALKPGARLALTTWAAPDRNPWASVPLTVMKKYMELPTPAPGQTGIFAFADPDRVRHTMAVAGFRDIAVEDLDVLWAGPESGRDYFSEVIEMAGPLASLYAKLPEQKKRAYADDVAQDLARTHFAGVKATELKHGALAGRERGRRQVLAFLADPRVQGAFAVDIWHKEFTLFTTIVDFWVEEAMRLDGIDLYDRGGNISPTHRHAKADLDPVDMALAS